MTHYKRYAQYKPSNINWLGDIPAHWEIRKLKMFSTLKARIGFHGLNSSHFINDGIYCITGTDFKNGSIDFSQCYHIAESWHALDENIQIQNNDILVTKDGTIGKVAIVSNLNKKATLNSGVFVLRPSSETISVKFFYFQLQSIVFKIQMDFIKRGSTINHLYERDFRNFIFPIPPLSEQIAIATYLDRKLFDIDTFIAKKQRLVTLLQEQKAAMINKAVTKGLNENKMRPSGIAWLGDIPAHWEIRKLKYVVSCNDEALSDKTDAKTLIQYVDIGNVDSLGNILEIATYMYKDAPSRARRITRQGDVIISTVRTYLKAIAEIKQNNLIVSTGFAVLRPNLKIISSPFLYLALQADYFIHKVNANSVGVGYPAINASELVKLKIPVPPLSEQIAIVSHIETESARIDKAISLVERELTLVQEYRTALIAEAVTGKYDCTP